MTVDVWLVESSASQEEQVNDSTSALQPTPEKTDEFGVNLVIKEELQSPPPSPQTLKVHNLIYGNKRVEFESPLNVDPEQKVFRVVIGQNGHKIILPSSMLQKCGTGTNNRALLSFGSSLLQPKSPQLGAKPVIVLKMGSGRKQMPVLQPTGSTLKLASPPPLVLIKKKLTNNILTTFDAPTIWSTILGVKTVLRKIDDSKVRFQDQFEQLKFKYVDHLDCAAVSLMRSLPLISEKLSRNAEYKTLHPYIVSSREKFLKMKTGTQRAHEIARAKEILQVLLAQGFQVGNPWRLVHLSRLYCFTPMADKNFFLPCLYPAETNIGEKYSNAENIMPTEAEQELEHAIDIESCEPCSKKKEPIASIVLLDETLLEDVAACDFVKQTARQIAVALEPEALTQSSSYRSAETLIYQASMLFVEEILRLSYLKALCRQKRCVSSIEIEDVHAALRHRLEFDILGNEGLGIDCDK